MRRAGLASYLAAFGLSSALVIVTDDVCEVTVELAVSTKLLPGGPWEVSATERAVALYGVEAPAMSGLRTWLFAVFPLLLAVGCSNDDGGEVADRSPSTTSSSTSSSTTTSSTTAPPSDTELGVEAWDTAWELATTEGSRADQLV